MRKPHPFMKELRRERCATEISQVLVCDTIGVGRTTLQRAELGESMPTIDVVERYAAMLGYELRLVRKEAT